LLEDVKRWGAWVQDEAGKELRTFYPNEDDGSVLVGYVWSNVIPCQNPSCNAEIPLIGQYWLSRKDGYDVTLHPHVEGKSVNFEVVGRGFKPIPRGFDPSSGSVSRAVATCLVCGSPVDNKTTAKLFRSGKSSQRLLAVISHKEGVLGKKYRVSEARDMLTFKKAESYLQKKIESLANEWGMNPVPDEPTPEGKGRGAERAFSIRNYNMNSWGELFNSRQKLSLVTFIEKVRKAHDKMLLEGYDPNYARAVTSYLALGVDRLADFGSTLCLLNPTGGRGVVHTFGRQGLQMVWDYTESNPFNPLGAGWPTACEKNQKWLEHASTIRNRPAVVSQSSATKLPYPDSYFDAVFTDPPYYDNVPYSYLSDFFYVWLKRAVGALYPDLFATPLAPKAEEIVAYSNLEGGFEEGKRRFDQMLGKSFTEINRVLKPKGISVIVYAHKSTAGWETLVNSILRSGLVVTGAWPIHTERPGRLRSMKSAALASSIYMVARKMSKEQVGFYKEVKDALQRHLNEKLDMLWKEGISGADFFIAAIGSAIEVFGKYERIIDDAGKAIEVTKLLEDVRRIVTDYAVKQVLHNGIAGEISPLTRFYVLWRWAYGEASMEYDEAGKLAQGIGIDLVREWNKGFILKDKEFVRVIGPEDRDTEKLEQSKELIDVLHRVLILWKNGKNEEVLSVLKDAGFGRGDQFYKVADAILHSLPDSSKEKKLLEGFLQGRNRISEDLRKQTEQTKLFE
jgi:adenine-specific DNA methylase